MILKVPISLLLYTGLYKCCLLQILQVQNKALYQQYCSRKLLVNPTERRLWHAVPVDYVEHINTYGFDRHYMRQQGML